MTAAFDGPKSPLATCKQLLLDRLSFSLKAVCCRTESPVVSGTFTIPLNEENHAEQLDRMDQAFILRSFIGGHENELVHWSLGQLRDRATEVNPLTFYGPTSTGKTTLLCGLEHSWTTAMGDSAWLTNGVDFDRGYAYALETGAVAEFREKFRRHGLVIIDDLHLLNEKAAVQQEFTNLLDWRIEARAPVILTLNKSPIELTGLNEGLVSRLAGGMLIPLQLPTPNTRRAILDQLLKQACLDFPVEVREAIAGQRSELASPFCTVPELRHAVARYLRQRREISLVDPMHGLDVPGAGGEHERIGITEGFPREIHLLNPAPLDHQGSRDARKCPCAQRGGDDPIPHHHKDIAPRSLTQPTLGVRHERLARTLASGFGECDHILGVGRRLHPCEWAALISWPRHRDHRGRFGPSGHRSGSYHRRRTGSPRRTIRSQRA